MKTLWIILAVAVSGQLIAQNNFRFHDSLTYQLYRQESWKELTDAGRRALRAGNDYYFLRMRLGIAAVMQNKQRLAAAHFTNALRFNSGCTIARHYLINAHHKSGMEIENDHFETILTRIRKQNFLHSFTFAVGGAIPTHEGRTLSTNVDGEYNIYGELTHSGSLSYLHAGTTFKPFRFARSHLAVSNLWLQRHQFALLGGTDTLRHNRTLRQQHLSGNLTLRIAHGLYFMPSASLLLISDKPMKISYDANTGAYMTVAHDTAFVQQYYSMRMLKELPFLSAGISAGVGKLSARHHWQASSQVAFYPFANLNLYTVSAITAVGSGNASIRWFFRQRFGIALSDRLWLEADHIDGYLRNVFDEYGLQVFNPVGEIQRRSSLSILFIFSQQLHFRIETAMVRLKDFYITYTDFNNFVIENYKLNHYHLSGGVTWNL